MFFQFLIKNLFYSFIESIKFINQSFDFLNFQFFLTISLTSYSNYLTLNLIKFFIEKSPKYSFSFIIKKWPY